VTLALDAANNAGTLSGTATATAVDGIASFDGLSVTRPGHDYRLTASAPSLSTGSSAPFDVLVNFKSISVGGAHACGITPDGTAYCWGHNGSGRLGDGTMVSRPVPVPVVGHLAFTSISTGSPHSCALTAAGTAYCWGDNGTGELGVGSSVFNSVSPLAVSGGITFAFIAADWHTCGVTAAGSAYCWGDGGFALGAGQIPGGGIVTEPTPVLGGLAFTSITSGLSFTCGLTTDGDAYCAGDNSSGELGNGTTVATDTMVAVAGGHHFVSLKVLMGLLIDALRQERAARVALTERLEETRRMIEAGT